MDPTAMPRRARLGLGQIKIALSTGKVTPELTEGLRQMYPSLYSEMKADMLMRCYRPCLRVSSSKDCHKQHGGLCRRAARIMRILRKATNLSLVNSLDL